MHTHHVPASGRPLHARVSESLTGILLAYFSPLTAERWLSTDGHNSGPLALATMVSEAKLIYSSRYVFLVQVPRGSSVTP